MMSDLRNLKVLAWFLQKFELNFDILSSLKELSKQIKGEFDFRWAKFVFTHRRWVPRDSPYFTSTVKTKRFALLLSTHPIPSSPLNRFFKRATPPPLRVCWLSLVLAVRSEAKTMDRMHGSLEEHSRRIHVPTSRLSTKRVLIMSYLEV